jgi:hypothetical protein
VNSKEIVKIVAEFSLKYVPNHYDDPSAPASAASEKKWKRQFKQKLVTALNSFYEGMFGTTAQEFEEALEDGDGGFEYIDVINNQDLSDDCIARHFMNDDFEDGLDALVITDPLDTKIIAILWHAD